MSEIDVGGFLFNGKSSIEDFGIFCSTVMPFLPPKRSRKIQVPGMDGLYDYGSQNYDEIGIRLKCYCSTEYTRATIREVVYWLDKKARLYLWDEPEKYYMAELFNGPDIDWENVARMDPFDLEFVCEPFAYKDVSGKSLQSGLNSILYSGTRRTPCVITLRNENDFSISNIRVSVIEREGEV